jgi:hypothetical protein
MNIKKFFFKKELNEKKKTAQDMREEFNKDIENLRKKKLKCCR